jgi:tetrahydromethanopterin S-methyltransferase subunit G
LLGELRSRIGRVCRVVGGLMGVVVVMMVKEVVVVVIVFGSDW